MSDTLWDKFGWQELELDVPADWNLGRVDGSYEKGYEPSTRDSAFGSRMAKVTGA